MYWVYSLAPPFLVVSIIISVLLLHSTYSRRLIFKVSYDLCFISYYWVDTITSSCYKSLVL